MFDTNQPIWLISNGNSFKIREYKLAEVVVVSFRMFMICNRSLLDNCPILFELLPAELRTKWSTFILAVLTALGRDSNDWDYDNTMFQ